MQNLKKLKGDASHRKFFRKKTNFGNSIVIQAKKDKFKNLLVYDAISKILNKNKVLAPKLYQENYKNNYIEVEDFGNETIFKILKKSKNKKFLYFKNIIKLLNQVQSIKDKKIRNFKNNFFSEFLATFILIFGILYIVEPNIIVEGLDANFGIGSLGALPVGILVWVIGLSLGGTTGYAINPARDLGPRIIYQLIPRKNKISDWAYSWIPIFGPSLGAVAAGLLYLYFN